jgi:hypothetical protein
MPVALIRAAAASLDLARSEFLDAQANFLGEFEKALIATLPEPAKGIVEHVIERNDDALTPTNPIMALILAHACDARRDVLDKEDTPAFHIVAWWVGECVTDVLRLIAEGQGNVVAFPSRRT